MEYKDYYKIMGLARDASQDEVKRAYRKLARKYHPDVSKLSDAEQRFKELGEAYEVLKDPEKRAAYDRLGSQWQAGQEFRPPPGWDTGFQFGGGGFTTEGLGGFSDFFDALFGGARPRGATTRTGLRMRGQDHNARIRVSLEEAYHGTTRAITFHVSEVASDGTMRPRGKTLNVHIPRGVKQGQRIRLNGQGGPGVGGGPAGDLFLEIELESHRLFRAEGRDIYLDLPITPWEAALGASIAVPTLGGKVDMKIPNGSQSGHKLRLKGRGLGGSPPGDQYVILRIITPPATNEAAETVYRNMARALPFDPRAGIGG